MLEDFQLSPAAEPAPRRHGAGLARRRRQAAVLLAASLLIPWAPSVFAEQDATPAAKKAAEPFAFAGFTWLNGTSRTKDSVLDSKVFTGEFRKYLEVLLLDCDPATRCCAVFQHHASDSISEG